MYLEKNVVRKDTGIPVLIAALFAIAKTCNKPTYPFISEDMVCVYTYIHTMEYCSSIKKNEIMPSATTWIDLEVVILREVSQRKTNTICHHLYVESKKGGYK